MTATLGPYAPITAALAEQTIRQSVVSRQSRYLNINETAVMWITGLVRNVSQRPAEEVLAEIQTICEALAAVDLDFFSGEGTG
ncbi:MAG: hypothetical protein ABW156_11840 [Jiangellaceae bacterium]